MSKLVRGACALLALGAVAGFSGGLEPKVAEAAMPSVRWIPAASSNFTRDGSRTINLIVIHTIEGSESSAINWFQNRSARVSAHYIVSHAGRVTQMVRDMDVAWHCRGGNPNSIGIENEGFAGRNNWTTTQLNTLADLVRALCDRYGVPKDRAHIKGHNEIPGNDHSDPGRFFPWTNFIAMVRGGSSGGGGNPPPPPPPPPPPTQGTFAVECTASSLNVRSSIMGTILGTVPSGSRFVVRSSQSGWHKINWRGRDAWISGDFVKRVSDDGITVTADTLNVRSGASTSNSILGQTRAGQKYVAFQRSGDWVLIQFDQRRGWVHGDYTNPASF